MQLHRLAAAAAALCCAAGAQAALFTFSGDIENHNDVVRIGFSLDDDATDVRVWTDSWLGGVNFDPITALWQRSGGDYLRLAQNDDNGGVGPGQTRWDSGFVLPTLAAGDYLFTVARYPNWANGSRLSQGFAFDAAAPQALNGGTFWRVHLSGVDHASDGNDVPEPATFALAVLGLAGLGVARRRARG